MVDITEKQLVMSPPAAELARVLSAGVLVLREDGGLAASDAKALALLGVQEHGELARRWDEIGSLLKGVETGTASFLLPVGEGGRPVLFEAHRPGPSATEPAAGGLIFLVRDGEALAHTAADLHLATYLRTLSQVTPAVAHDLRAPINAMVFNIEILKETIAGSRSLEPAARERQLRYVSVLRDELTRLHTGLEHFLSHVSSRGDRIEGIDLREVVKELTALLVPQARKHQVQVVADLPDHPVSFTGNRLQLRQALLEIGIAALSGVAKAGILGIRLENGNSRARILLAGPLSPEAPAVDFELSLGAPAAGHARLYHARATLVELGGRLAERGAGGERSFEVELPVSGKE